VKVSSKPGITRILTSQFALNVCHILVAAEEQLNQLDPLRARQRTFNREEAVRYTFVGEIPLWNEFRVRSARDMEAREE